jgi:octaprenyl-diphosphate synthase
VHNATLLHDDVVDLGDRRRGAPTARVIYGNAASIYAGDWLLVEALGASVAGHERPARPRARRARPDARRRGAAARAARHRRGATMDDYFEVVEGKTASLFRWAMYAGAARAPRRGPCARSSAYGATRWAWPSR